MTSKTRKEDKELIGHYENIREMALSGFIKSAENKIKGVGILIQQGMAVWIKLINDFQYLPNINQRHERYNRYNSSLQPEIDLSNILINISLRIIEGEI